MNVKDPNADPELMRLLKDHAHDDPAKLALLWSKKKDFPLTWMLNQIAGRQIAKNKIPSWFSCDAIIYPSGIALEQCSSELTALYKTQLTQASRIADLTGGLGVDTWAFSLTADEVLYCEPHAERFECAQHNFKSLGRNTIHCEHITAEDSFPILEKFKPDLIYLDPSRRDANQRRAFLLSALQPDILQLKEKLLGIAPEILLKAAPMLDIKEAIRLLENVKSVHILSTKNECKELVFLIGRDKIDDQHVYCVELQENKKISFDFRYAHEEKLEIITGPIDNFIFDPYASVTKAGAFKSISEKFKINALHANTHLYTHDQHVKGFPGKTFKVIEVLPYDPSLLRESVSDGKAALAFRNFPVSPAEVEKKLKMKSSASVYLFFVTDHDAHLRVIKCELINN